MFPLINIQSAFSWQSSLSYLKWFNHTINVPYFYMDGGGWASMMGFENNDTVPKENVSPSRLISGLSDSTQPFWWISALSCWELFLGLDLLAVPQTPPNSCYKHHCNSPTFFPVWKVKSSILTWHPSPNLECTWEAPRDHRWGRQRSLGRWIGKSASRDQTASEQTLKVARILRAALPVASCLSFQHQLTTSPC